MSHNLYNFKIILTRILIYILIIIFFFDVLVLSIVDLISVIFILILFNQTIYLFNNLDNNLNKYIIILNVSIICFYLLKLVDIDLGFQLTYLLSHILTMILLCIMLYLTNKRWMEKNINRVLLASFILIAFYIFSYKTDGDVFLFLSHTLYFLYLFVFLFILWSNRKKFKYYNRVQRNIGILTILFLVLIYLGSYVFSERGIFFEGNKLFAWNTILLIIINDSLNVNRLSIYSIVIGIIVFIIVYLLVRFFNIGQINKLIIFFLLILLFAYYLYTILKAKKANNIKDIIKQENEYKTYSNYLHDEILQDILNIKQKTDDENIIKDLDILIKRIREAIEFYGPTIDSNIDLKDLYQILIKDITRRYDNKNILVDFYCEDDLYISQPYDLIIYKFIRECLTNIYKHTDSIFAEINLYVEDSNIILIVGNDQGYLNKQDLLESKIGRGWSYIIETLEMLNGEFNIKNDEGVEINITIPYEGRYYFEYFTN